MRGLYGSDHLGVERALGSCRGPSLSHFSRSLAQIFLLVNVLNAGELRLQTAQDVPGASRFPLLLPETAAAWGGALPLELRRRAGQPDVHLTGLLRGWWSSSVGC